MSLESLTTQDQVVVQNDVQGTDDQMGVTHGYADTSTILKCLVQTEGFDTQKYAARGWMMTHQVFFSSKPSITARNRLKWVNYDGEAVFLRILNVYSEGRPGQYMLWVADCEQETTRREV